MIKEIKNNWILYLSILLLACGYISEIIRHDNLKAKIKPCECLNIHDMLLIIAKSELFVDSLNYCKKADRERLTDSVTKYRSILKIN